MVRCLFSDMMYKMLKATCMSNSEQKCSRACSKQGIMFYGFERSKSREITEVLTYYCGAVQLWTFKWFRWIISEIWLKFVIVQNTVTRKRHNLSYLRIKQIETCKGRNKHRKTTGSGPFIFSKVIFNKRNSIYAS